MIKKNTIRSQEQLIKYFKDDSLRMSKNSFLSFEKNLELGSNVLFEGKVNVGKNNKIDSNCNLKNVEIGSNNHIKMSSLINDSSISNNIIIGPFAYVREKTKIGKNCIIGAYVEITRSFIQDTVYISHRAFIGDANIGKKTIIGAGTVFCNFNFKNNFKEKSIIGNNCKVGANSTVIAPCKLSSNSIVPALTKLKNR